MLTVDGRVDADTRNEEPVVGAVDVGIDLRRAVGLEPARAADLAEVSDLPDDAEQVTDAVEKAAAADAFLGGRERARPPEIVPVPVTVGIELDPLFADEVRPRRPAEADRGAGEAAALQRSPEQERPAASHERPGLRGDLATARLRDDAPVTRDAAGERAHCEGRLIGLEVDARKRAGLKAVVEDADLQPLAGGPGQRSPGEGNQRRRTGAVGGRVIEDGARRIGSPREPQDANGDSGYGEEQKGEDEDGASGHAGSFRYARDTAGTQRVT
jgi:hypothetical protein